jgi:hypothetical protein
MSVEMKPRLRRVSVLELVAFATAAAAVVSFVWVVSVQSAEQARNRRLIALVQASRSEGSYRLCLSTRLLVHAAYQPLGAKGGGEARRVLHLVGLDDCRAYARLTNVAHHGR